MRKGKAIFVLSLLLVTLTACQPTPEEEIVQNRKDGSLEQAIVATAAPTFAPEEKYEVPDRWTEELEFRGEKIYIDADIEVADGDAFEVLTITKNDFTKDNVLASFRTLFGENLEIREQERSYDELLVDLQNTQKGIFADYDENTGEIIWESYEEQEEDIQELKDLLAQTDPEESFVPLEDEIEFPIIEGRLLRTESGERWYAICNTDRYTLSKHRNMKYQYEKTVMEGDAYPGEKGHALEDPGITEAEAIEMAQAFIAPLGKDEMYVANVEKARELESYTYKVFSTGYYITMVSNPANTIPVFYSSYSGNYFLHFSEDDEAMYNEYWVQERMALYVTSEGVQMFAWNYRKKVVDVANENVTLLPFEQIQERMRALLEYGVRDGSNNPIYITRIVLGSAIQQVADQGDEAFLVPAWMVFFTTERHRTMGMKESLMMISALDGSYISQWG